jgi:hypothetical protein
MGFGLGKHSPIVLSLGKGNYEAMIERHGQWVRWRTAKKCPCITDNHPDIHCPKCGGIGDIYGYQREYEDVFRVKARDNLISLPEEYGSAEILEIYDSRGRKYPFCKYGDFIQVMEEVENNALLDMRLRIPMVKRLESVALEKAGGGYYRVPGILTAPSKLEGVFYQTAGDVIAAADLKDADRNTVNVLGFRRDMILADSLSERVTAGYVEYIMPFKFIVLSQNLSKEDSALVNAHSGEAVCTYPYMYNVSENDVLTILSGTMTHKTVLEKRGDGIADRIPEFFVAQVDGIDTKTASYTEEADFALIGANEIRWVGNEPAAGEMMSVTYRYYPTYRVAKDIPMLRTSEDQRIPRKAVLKLYAAFGEAKRINRND